MVNWIHAAHTSLLIYKSFISSKDVNLIAQLDAIIEKWTTADNSRNDPRKLLEYFGKGFALFTELPNDIKESNMTYVMGALSEASFIANQNKIRVTFDVTGAIFT